MLKSASYICRLEKQQLFLKSKGKDIVYYSLKTINELDKAEEKEKQIKPKQVATAAMLSNVLVLSTTKTNPFVGLKVLLLPPKV
jgi:hypothetical protein